MDWKNDKYTLGISDFDSEEWQKIVDHFACEPNAELYHSTKIQAYRYAINIKVGSSSIFLGYWHNTQMSNNLGMHSLKMEFNFTKVENNAIFDWLCVNLIYPHLSRIYVSRVDMCTDIDVPISNLIVDKGRKKNTRSYNDTMYFGDRGRNGAIKIYDKGKELGTDDVITRYEITLKPISLRADKRMYLTDKQFLCAYSLVDTKVIDTWQIGIDIDPVLKATVLCVLNGDMQIGEFSYYYRKKIKDFMDKMKSFSINDDCQDDINKAAINEMQLLITYISILHGRHVFGNKNSMPF